MCCIAKILIFGACVQLCFSFRTADVLHVENLLYLSLVLNLFFDSALPMNCIGKELLYLALVVNCPFCLALPMCCIAKNSYIWRYLFWTTSFIPYRSWAALRNTFDIWCFVFNLFFRLPLVMWCYENRPMFGAYFAIPLLFVTFLVLTCKIPLLFCACVDLHHLFRTLYVFCNTT